MSSNQYGFSCVIDWNGRSYEVQIVYRGTEDDDPESLEYATRDWESQDPVALAQYELEHRDWVQKYSADVRIGVWSISGGWLETDPHLSTWLPPTPSELEILEIISAGRARDIDHGWDT